MSTLHKSDDTIRHHVTRQTDMSVSAIKLRQMPSKFTTHSFYACFKLSNKPVQPSDKRGSFSSDVGLFQGLKIAVPSGCLGETSIFKIIIMIDNITLWQCCAIPKIGATVTIPSKVSRYSILPRCQKCAVQFQCRSEFASLSTQSTYRLQQKYEIGLHLLIAARALIVVL